MLVGEVALDALKRDVPATAETVPASLKLTALETRHDLFTGHPESLTGFLKRDTLRLLAGTVHKAYFLGSWLPHSVCGVSRETHYSARYATAQGVVRMAQPSDGNAAAEYKEAFRDRLFDLVSNWERIHHKRVSHREIASFIAEEIGENAIHPTQISRWIKGETLPEMYRVRPLANYFGATGAFLGHGEGEAPELRLVKGTSKKKKIWRARGADRRR